MRIRKVVAFTIILIMLLSSLVVYAAEQEQYYGKAGETVIWGYNTSTKILSLTGKGEMYDWAENKVPWDRFKKDITVVNIGEGITTIGSHAFLGFKSIEEISLPRTLKRIGTAAINDNPALKSLDLPDGLEHIGESQFNYCGFTSLDIPASVKEIGSYSFWIKGLRNIYFYGNAPKIGESCFYFPAGYPTYDYLKLETKINHLEGTKGWDNLSWQNENKAVFEVDKKDDVIEEEVPEEVVVKKFSDLVETAWYYDTVMTLVKKGAINGYTDGTFQPQGTITNAEFLTILMKTTSKINYTKVNPTDHWAMGVMIEAYEKAIVEYTEMSVKDFDKPITRAAMAKYTENAVNYILGEKAVNVKGIEEKINDYDEIKNTPYDYYIKQVYARGIIVGDNNNNFNPTDNATRAEASAIILRAIDKTQRK